MTNFISPLYNSEKKSEARNLYENIKRLILSRINSLVSAKENTGSDYINDLISQELKTYKNLINIISEFENEKYFSNELSEYNQY